MRLKAIIFFALVVILYLYPLFFGYTSWFSIELKIIGLWLVCLVSGIIYVDFGKSSAWKYFRIAISIFLLLMFLAIKEYLLIKSEDVYYYTHKDVFNRIHKTDFESESSKHIQKLSAEEYYYDDYRVFKTKSVTAIGIKGILDNTDGFLYWNEVDPLPTGFFEGRLTFTERIEGKWYKFSTR